MRPAFVSKAALLERESELEVLRELIANAVSDLGAVALIEGPAGIGKSSLLNEAMALAREMGCSTATARCNELERDFAFGLARQLFEPRLAGLDPERRRHLLTGAAGLAAPVVEPLGFDELAPRGGASYAALHGLYWLTANLAADRPLALGVDDVHWADAPSLRFLAYLANRIGDLPVFLALAVRPHEPEAEVNLLDELAATPATRPIRPQPLSPEAVQAVVGSVLGADPDPGLAEALSSASTGNPLLLRELLASMLAEEIPPTADQVARVRGLAPRSVARSVRRRLRRLGPQAEAMARAIAVLGGGPSPGTAARLAEVEATSAADLLDVLALADIVERDSLDFVHPVVRAAIYSELSPAERARQHRSAATILAAAGADDDEIALHVRAGAPGGDEWAVDVLRRAAHRARARGAPDVAVTYLERAASEPPPPEERADVLVELGLAEMAAGQPRGVATLREALRLAERPRARAAVSLELGGSLMTMGSFAEAAEVFEQALAELEGSDAELRQRLEGKLISACVPVPALVPRVLGRIAPLMLDNTRVSDPVILATLAAAMSGSIEPAESAAEVAQRALAGGLSMEDDPTVLGYAVGALMTADRLEEAKAVWDQTIAEARGRGSIPAVAGASTFRALVLVRLGELPEAEADARTALENTHEDVVLPLPVVITSLVDVLIEMGELDEAERLLEEHQLGGELPDSLVTHLLLESRGRLRTAQGRLDVGIDDLRECGRRLQTWMVRNPALVPWRSSLALALAAAGERSEAITLAGEEMALGRAFQVPRELGMALRAAGLIEGGDAGIDFLRQAVTVLESSPAALERARALTDLGAALRRRGKRSDAREPLRAGLELAQRCGAGALAERAHRELVSTGARPRRLVRSGVDALTASERRVAAMASEGLTNREIAQALFVSAKTVETHLGHAYRKLDIGSRTQLSRALRGRDQAASRPAALDGRGSPGSVDDVAGPPRHNRG
jgi:DNA-binding CsgD family transcriptional regulator